MQQPSQQPSYSSYPPPNTPFSLQPPSTRKIALKYGFIFGAILVVSYLIRYAIEQAVIRTREQAVIHNTQLNYSFSTYVLLLSLLIPAIFTVIDWIIYFLTGFFAARRTRQVSTAVIASLWANLCYGVIYCVVIGISTIHFRFLLAYDSPLWTAYLRGLGSSIAITLILLHLGLGTGIGALGGLLGKSMATRALFSHPTSTLP